VALEPQRRPRWLDMPSHLDRLAARGGDPLLGYARLAAG
jgi:hypothetical protein